MKRILGAAVAALVMVLGLLAFSPAQAGGPGTLAVSGKLVGPQQKGWEYTVSFTSWTDNPAGNEFIAKVNSSGKYRFGSLPANDQYEVVFKASRKGETFTIPYGATTKKPYPANSSIVVFSSDETLQTQYFVALKGKVSNGKKGTTVTAAVPKKGTKGTRHLGDPAVTKKGGKYLLPLVVSGKKGQKYFTTADPTWNLKWAGGKSSLKKAKPSGKAVTRNIKVKRTGSISGTLKLPKNTTEQDREVTAWRGGKWAMNTYADAKTGKWKIKGLPAGKYKVTFAKTPAYGGMGEAYTVPARIYKGKKEKVGLGKGTTVKVSSGKAVKGIDDKLVRKHGGTVSGKVKKANKKHGFLIRFVPKNKNLSIRSGSTDTKGRYKAGGLSPGTYRVELYEWGTDKMYDKGTVKVKANKTTKKNF